MHVFTACRSFFFLFQCILLIFIYFTAARRKRFCFHELQGLVWAVLLEPKKMKNIKIKKRRFYENEKCKWRHFWASAIKDWRYQPLVFCHDLSHYHDYAVLSKLKPPFLYVLMFNQLKNVLLDPAIHLVVSLNNAPDRKSVV